jgi:hypothetical protein
MGVAYLISRRLFAHSVEPKFVERLFGVGYASTAIMFWAHNMWVFLGGIAMVSLLAVRRFTYPLAIFVFLLLLMPGYSARVPGFGLVNWLIDLTPWRVLALTVLLPSSIYLISQRQLPKAGSLLTDKLVIAFVLHVSMLNYLHQDTFTGGLRQFAMGILDILLLYFVASRGLILKGAFRHVMVALVMAAIYLALVGTFELLRHWLLYSAVKGALGATTGMFNYLGRGGVLRASATTGQPIVLGFVMMAAFLMTTYVQKLVQHGTNRTLLWLLMGAGLLAAMSRGPWVGAAIGLFAIAGFSANSVVNLVKLSAMGVCAAVVLIMLPGGEKIIDYLPWIGTIDAANITYREMLWEQTQLVIGKHFWFGSIGYNNFSEFDVIRQGGGFVDIVNSYVGVVLAYGVVGLFLYVSYLFLVIFKSIITTQKHKRGYSEQKIYGVALLGTLLAMAITILTVSSISQIGSMLTLFFAAGVAHVNLFESRVQTISNGYGSKYHAIQ